MPPRIHPPSKAISSILRLRKPHSSSHRSYATVQAITPAFSPSKVANEPHPYLSHPPTQPPSFKPPQFRKSQLLRQYASLLRSTPLILLFQHNNIKSNEWMAIRRELTKALQKTDASLPPPPAPTSKKGKAKPEPVEKQSYAEGVQLQIIQTGIFAAALRIVEYYKPGEKGEKRMHVLSESAHSSLPKNRFKHPLSSLLAGPLVLLTLPTVSPQHLATALSILSPSPPKFPRPTQKGNPSWHDPMVQSGLQKLLLLGARVEEKVFDVEGTKWVGGIEGGLDGLRGQVVGMLSAAGGANLTGVLEGTSRSLYFAMEGRRGMLEDEAKGGEEAKGAEEEKRE